MLARTTARGLTFDVEVGGPDDGTPVVLLHGFPQGRSMWRSITPALHAAGLRTYAVDQRGYSPGAQPAGVRSYALSECVADIPAIADALGLGAFHLVAHDWGAGVAWQLAGDLPERVSTLTAVSVPHPRAMVRAMMTDGEQRRQLTYMRMFRAEGAERALLANDGFLLRLVFTESGLDETASAPYVAKMREPGVLSGGLNWYRAMRPTDALRAGPVRVPTTFVWSDGDLAIGPTAAERCHRYVRADFRFVALPGVSHWIADLAPDELTGAVLARIRS